MERKGLDRGEYFVWLIVVKLAVMAAAFLGAFVWVMLNPYVRTEDMNMVTTIATVAEVVAVVWLTTSRCVDIGISKSNAWWLLVPFAMFYFMLRRGNAYYDSRAPVLGLETTDDPIS